MTAVETTDAQTSPAETKPAKRPLYPRLLRLRHIAPNAWQRAALGEGALAVALLLVLADLASAWTMLALPLAVAGVVKAHDVLAGLLPTQPAIGQPQLVAEDPEAWCEEASDEVAPPDGLPRDRG